MRLRFLGKLLLIAALTAAANCSFAQSPSVPDQDYLALLRATRFVENYIEVAAVSARVFAARDQGSDAEYAKAMEQVSRSNPTTAEPCLIHVYRRQAFTLQEVRELIEFFSGTLGRKVLAESQRSQVASYEALSVKPMKADAFTVKEKHELAVIYQSPSFRKYATMSTNRDVVGAMMQCLLQAAGVSNASQ